MIKTATAAKTTRKPTVVGTMIATLRFKINHLAKPLQDLIFRVSTFLASKKAYFIELDMF